MGIGYFGIHTAIVMDTDMKKFFPDDMKELEEREDWEHFAQIVNDCDPEEYPEVQVIVIRIANKFRKMTGLEIWPNYHDQSEGSRYDDISGVYWEVRGAMGLNEKALKSPIPITEVSFVEFG